jgi:hypothetical protein
MHIWFCKSRQNLFLKLLYNSHILRKQISFLGQVKIEINSSFGCFCFLFLPDTKFVQELLYLSKKNQNDVKKER